MKKYIVILLVILTTNLSAQLKDLRPQEGYLGGGLGLTWIDGKPHYSLRMFPEVAFSNVGIGLDFKLEFDPNGKVRTENFNEFSDYLSVIRYVRYGYKKDPLYFRVGALDRATLGHGTIMYMYNNSISYDTRKVGLEFDIDFSNFGFESVYGNFGQAGLIGFRAYIKPLKMVNSSIPILSNIEAGFSVVSDVDENAGIINGLYNFDTEQYLTKKDEGAVTIVGFDFGLPIIRTSMFNLDAYFDINKIAKYGSGTAAGIKMDLNGLGLINLSAKLERRFNKGQYLPSYFNSLYEVERFNIDQETGVVTSKIQQLQNANDQGNGTYGELYITLLNTFDILGSYQRLDKVAESGVLHIVSDISPEGMPYVARFGYDKINIGGERDLFTLDDRSHLYAEFGYKANEYLLVSMVYHWTFTPVRDGNDNVIKFEPQKKIEPRISLIYPINFGG